MNRNDLANQPTTKSYYIGCINWPKTPKPCTPPCSTTQQYNKNDNIQTNINNYRVAANITEYKIKSDDGAASLFRRYLTARRIIPETDGRILIIEDSMENQIKNEPTLILT